MSHLDELNKPMPLSEEMMSFYQTNNYIKLKNVFSSDLIQYFNKIVTDRAFLMQQPDIPLEKRDTYGKAFVQLFNLWTIDDLVKTLVFSKRLAGIAAQLLGVDGVRLYHDQALFKESGGGITPWHADQYYWPLDSDKTITAWIPLQKTPLEMGPLEFSAGSQQIKTGRDLSISDESEAMIGQRLRVTDFEHVVEAFDVGEVSFHSGWIFHRAGANQTKDTRKVMTIIYMDSKMRLKEPENEGQINDWKTWCPGVEVGEVIQSHLNPALVDLNQDFK